MAVAMVADDVNFAETEQNRRPRALLADSPAAAQGRDPVPPASCRHLRDPSKERSASPRNCCIRRGSATRNHAVTFKSSSYHNEIYKLTI